jgi:hypothetical protein
MSKNPASIPHIPYKKNKSNFLNLHRLAKLIPAISLPFVFLCLRTMPDVVCLSVHAPFDPSLLFINYLAFLFLM